MKVSEPVANEPPVEVSPGVLVQKKVCACCKEDAKTRTRYFVWDQGNLVCMALSWERLCQAREWDSVQP